MPYLRFTPQEYRAICRACRAVDFADEFFDAFQHFLVDALHDVWRDLALRLAQLDPVHVHLLYENLQQRKARKVRRGRPPAGKNDSDLGLTFEELQQVARAAQRFLLYDGRREGLQDYLVHHFKQSAPQLALKVARLSRRQAGQLYDQVIRPKRWHA